MSLAHFRKCFRLHCPDRSLTQRRILEQSESILLRVTNVLRHNAVQVVSPNRVLIDESIAGRFVALILHVQNFLQELADDVVILVVMNAQVSG